MRKPEVNRIYGGTVEILEAMLTDSEIPTYVSDGEVAGARPIKLRKLNWNKFELKIMVKNREVVVTVDNQGNIVADDADNACLVSAGIPNEKTNKECYLTTTPCNNNNQSSPTKDSATNPCECACECKSKSKSIPVLGPTKENLAKFLAGFNSFLLYFPEAEGCEKYYMHFSYDAFEILGETGEIRLSGDVGILEYNSNSKHGTLMLK